MGLRPFSISAGWRSIAAQYVLDKNCRTKGGNAVARVGLSNHGDGTAFDLAGAYPDQASCAKRARADEARRDVLLRAHAGWGEVFERHNFLWFGSDEDLSVCGDPPHFDHVGDDSREFRALAKEAFRVLWNNRNPCDEVKKGDDAALLDRLAKSPAAGFGSIERLNTEEGVQGGGCPGPSGRGDTCFICSEKAFCMRADSRCCGADGEECSYRPDTNSDADYAYPGICKAGRCEACGVLGGRCCHPNQEPSGTPARLTVNESGCDARPEREFDNRNSCLDGICSECGLAGQPCCAGDVCARGVCKAGRCVGCGIGSLPCCAGTPEGASCEHSGTCTKGTCLEPEVSGLPVCTPMQPPSLQGHAARGTGRATVLNDGAYRGRSRSIKSALAHVAVGGHFQGHAAGSARPAP